MYCLGTPWRPLETLLLLEVQWKVEKANYLDSDAGSAEIGTRIAGFRVLSANRYTTEPLVAFSDQQGP